ncbi:uncharacterized protein LOC135208970 [Macrobrachium nipponense]|uniref:uncharacterized protein LOC135208970 n=1 Tax=Macrobrachium nipponense TaxID=159736 RepID=UPI0030C88D4A
MAHIVVLLLTALLSSELGGAAVIDLTWSLRKVRATRVNGTTTEKLQLPWKMDCAASGLNRDWCNMFCFDGITCHLTDTILVDPFEEEDDVGTIDCWTSRRRTSPCPVPYEQVPNVGCVNLLEKNYTWSDARSVCQKRGGDLATPVSLHALADYMIGIGVTAEYWVGALISSGWLDGRSINASDFVSFEPDYTGDCVRMKRSYNYLLGDTDCTNPKRGVCEY